MNKFWVLVVVVLLSGCVTERHVAGEDRAIQKVDKKAAANTRVSLGLRYLESGESEKAKLNLEMAEELDPSSVLVFLAQAHFYQEVEQFDLADEAFRKALSIEPNNGDTLNNYAVMNCKQGNYQQADILFQRALSNKAYLGVGNTNENAGLCALRSQDSAKALVYFKKALAFDSQLSRSMLGVAKIYIQEQQYALARDYLNRHSLTKAENAESIFAWLQLESASGNFAEEARLGQILLGKYPNSEQTKRYIGNDY
ncbi:type IV pilus biogenesis/stability protein PilW [Alginatibacterium sediminis]|uniref:Type IV pilus biogenesis/stability protein PilW n=1 Tax=Alginatibacterium sediminis TaxID=2164068 RepID=A0A420E891_9ALTE|nr:type IV pilus biogenesis/stability protein PilW [Alginatibacterium sediminis]RKF15528.1 type IV pilus biogenesis/stability protein PilW [Alginatibacterium sediminis]